VVTSLHCLLDTALHGSHHSIEQGGSARTPAPRDPLEAVEFPLGESDGKFLLFLAENVYSKETVSAKVSQNAGPVIDAD
jgi:hypothetical protein